MSLVNLLNDLETGIETKIEKQIELVNQRRRDMQLAEHGLKVALEYLTEYEGELAELRVAKYNAGY